MLGKTSVSMIVLLVTASLIGIPAYINTIEGQGPRVKVPQQLSAVGTLAAVRMIDSPAGKACAAALDITQTVSPGGPPPGTSIDLVAPNEHWCTLFVLSKIVSKTGIGFEAQNIKVTSLPPAMRTALLLPPNHPYLYRITEVDIL